MKKIILLLLPLVLCFSSQAQIDETDTKMLWLGLGLSKKVNKKFGISYYQLNSVNFEGPRLNFIQLDLGASYKLVDNLSVKAGGKATFSIDSDPENQLLYPRLYLALRYNTRISKRWRMKNSLYFEHHFDQRSKFQQRYFHRFDLYYRNTKWPWRLRPYITTKLYYYANGRDLQYYDENEDKTEKVATRGFHAFRFQPGVKLYPNKKIMLAVSFMRQIEFNSSLFGGKPINDENPKSGRIRRPFYNFNVFNLAFFYKL